MAKKFFWKIWLRLNLLTKKVDNDYIAEISTVGNTLRNEDIAQHIVKERSELRYETILSILNERDAVVRDTILGGSSVQDGNIHLAPRITGTWIGSDPVYDPKEHKVTVDAFPTAELRKALEEVGVELLGKKADGGAVIGLVTDVLTHKTDGTISPGGDIIIEGEKIKIAPDNDETLGVFFVYNGNMEIPLDYPITENNPKKILCRVPMYMSDGVYTLKVITRYSGSVLLMHPRTIVYELPLKVGEEGKPS
ncbi:MAG: DUF4469 domain-containing protein [Planctomycetaceae bacterium]|jgi:hypothetical protein|nr:DUF4469 domain-containing protein [Planctomycetaceae bacterium]